MGKEWILWRQQALAQLYGTGECTDRRGTVNSSSAIEYVPAAIHVCPSILNILYSDNCRMRYITFLHDCVIFTDINPNILRKLNDQEMRNTRKK